MADDATLRISLEEEETGGGRIPRDSGPEALAEEWVRFRQQITRLQEALDPAAIGQRAEVALELAHAHDELNRAMERQKDELLEMMPHLRPLAIDMEKEMRDFAEAMRKVQAEMDPAVAKQLAENELKLAEARNQSKKLYEAQLEDMRASLAPSTIPEVRPILDLEEATKKFELEMARLRESMDPNVARQLARQEAELSKERQAHKDRLATAKKDLGYDGPGGGLADLAMKLRGTIGGRSPILGSILDIFSAYGKAQKAGAEGGAAAGGLGAAAGPIAIAAAVFKALEMIKDGIGSAIRGIGNFTASLLDASPEVSTSVATMGSGISAVSDKLFYVSPILGIFGKAVGETIGALGAVMKALDGMVNRYATFSPQLQLGLAQAEIRQTLGDMRRAQESGPALLQYLQQRTDLQQKFEDIKIRILQRIMPAVLRVMELVEALLPLGEASLEPLLLMANALAEIASAAGGILGNQERAQQQERQADFVLPTAEFLTRNIATYVQEGGVRNPPGA